MSDLASNSGSDADEKQHIASKKHRRFATNPENFDSLDNLLFMLQRPLNPNIRLSDCPPCLDRHTKDDPCDLCDQPPVWTSSQEGSGNGSEVTEYDEGSGDDGEKDEVDGEEE